MTEVTLSFNSSSFTKKKPQKNKNINCLGIRLIFIHSLHFSMIIEQNIILNTLISFNTYSVFLP